MKRVSQAKTFHLSDDEKRKRRRSKLVRPLLCSNNIDFLFVIGNLLIQKQMSTQASSDQDARASVDVAPSSTQVESNQDFDSTDAKPIPPPPPAPPGSYKSNTPTPYSIYSNKYMHMYTNAVKFYMIMSCFWQNNF